VQAATKGYHMEQDPAGRGQSMLRQAQAALAQGDGERALAFAVAAERLHPGWAQASAQLFQLLARLGAVNEAISALTRQVVAERFAAFGSVNSLCAIMSLVGRPEVIAQIAQRHQPADLAERSGPLLFVGMPKSAGATIARSIAEHLGYGFAGIGVDLPDWAGMPAPWLHPELLQRFDGRRIVLLSHAAAIAHNEEPLSRFAGPLLVHVRDPRDALVSLFEMGESQSALQMLRFACLRPDYAVLSRQERLACLCERVYPRYLDWLLGWVSREQARPGSVLFSTFEDFLVDQEGMIRTLAGQLARRAQEGAEAARRPDVDMYVMHFRSGRSGSHKEVLDGETSRQLFAAIPAAVRERFGWTA